jgi:hypothetical protein
MKAISKFITLTFITLLMINHSFAACGDECLIPIINNTSQQLTTLKSLLVNYFKFSYSGSTLVPPAATYNLNPIIIKTLNQQQESAENEAKNDTQAIINMSLKQEIDLGALMAQSGGPGDLGGDFFNITPNVPTQQGGLWGNVLNTLPSRDNSLNVDEILAKDSIDLNATSGLPAKNFVRIVSGALIPLPITQNDLSEPAFVTNIWSIHAKESIILSNFYQMMRNRQVVPNLGQDLGLATEVGKDASPMQIEEYLVKRRVGNPDWYTKMEQASPSAVQRETLYVLAEIQRQLHLNAKQDERIIATLSALLAQQLEQAKLLIKGEQIAKDAEKYTQVE